MRSRSLAQTHMFLLLLLLLPLTTTTAAAYAAETTTISSFCFRVAVQLGAAILFTAALPCSPSLHKLGQRSLNKLDEVCASELQSLAAEELGCVSCVLPAMECGVVCHWPLLL